MYQCPSCGAMSLEPECEMCGPFEDKPKTKDEIDKIYGFGGSANNTVESDRAKGCEKSAMPCDECGDSACGIMSG